jgi:hypothetical protein
MTFVRMLRRDGHRIEAPSMTGRHWCCSSERCLSGAGPVFTAPRLSGPCARCGVPSRVRYRRVLPTGCRERSARAIRPAAGRESDRSSGVPGALRTPATARIGETSRRQAGTAERFVGADQATGQQGVTADPVRDASQRVHHLNTGVARHRDHGRYRWPAPAATVGDSAMSAHSAHRATRASVTPSGRTGSSADPSDLISLSRLARTSSSWRSQGARFARWVEIWCRRWSIAASLASTSSFVWRVGSLTGLALMVDKAIAVGSAALDAA